MTNLGNQFYDPFEAYENIEFEHHGKGWTYDEEDAHAPTTHGSIHIPGKRIPVSGKWVGLNAPGDAASGSPTRSWEDFRFNALSEIMETASPRSENSAPFMNIGVMTDPKLTPERGRGSGSSYSMAIAGRPVGVDLPAFGGDPAGHYPVDPPHSKVHTEGFWLGGVGRDVDPEFLGAAGPDPGAALHIREEDSDFPKGEQTPTGLPFSPLSWITPGERAGAGGLSAMKKVERWSQDPGGEPQGPGNPEFGTHTTDWVRERDLRTYRMGSRQVAARSKAVNPIEQLTSPEGVSTLSSATSGSHDYFTRELDRYMEHLRGGDDSFFKQGTEGMWNRALYRSYGDTGPMSSQKGQPGQVDFREGIVRPKHAAGKSFSSEEIEDMSDTQYRSVLADAANTQRVIPEGRMHGVQNVHSGLYGFLAEHIGDISHRMGQSYATEDTRDYDLHYPTEKVRKTTNTINHPYGFEREHAEQITENVDYYQNLEPDSKYPPKHPTTITTEEYTQQLDAAGESYSQAHEALPVYNAPMSKAREAAVHLGRQQFDEVRSDLKMLEYMTANQSRHNALMGQRNAVRWLKGQGR
tara:strand:+ start:256 stop:1992 length:1737 start_codon:yes stop_codon:yes gene_type:complete